MEHRPVLARLGPPVSRETLSLLERTILEALGFDPATPPVRDLASAYVSLSEAIHHAVHNPGKSTGSIAATPPRQADAIWGLVFGLRSFILAQQFLSAFPPHPGRLLDVGGGWGPWALAAASRDLPATVIEADPLRADFARRLHRRLLSPADVITTHHAPLPISPDVTTVCFSFSLREIVRTPLEAADLLSAAFATMPSQSRIFVIEAGTQRSASFLNQARDALVSRGTPIFGPCRTLHPCPLLARDDWCHFTWRKPLGPVGQQISDIAGRKSAELHFSWLGLGNHSTPDRSSARLVGLRSLGNKRTMLQLCAPDGLQETMVPLKEKKLRQLMTYGGTGALVPLKPWPSSAALSELVSGTLASAVAHVPDPVDDL